MTKALSEWDETYILSLPKEDNRIERKGSLKLDLNTGADHDGVLAELAKQLSAFANMGGGSLIYGLKDDGTVDGGGVSTQVKNGTKEWLERRIPELTDHEITGFIVREFEPRDANSQIQAGKALYVVSIPDSDRAPHQSKRDMKYYVRLGSQSLPAPHQMIEDIRNRQRHPRVFPSDITIRSLTINRYPDATSMVEVTLEVVLHNAGPLKSTDTFFQVKPSYGYFMNSCSSNATQVSGTKDGRTMFSLDRPLPPESDTVINIAYSLKARVGLHPTLRTRWEDEIGKPLDEIEIDWTVFADSAPPKKGTLSMGSTDLIKRLRES